MTAQLDQKLLRQAYLTMRRIREFEERVHLEFARICTFRVQRKLRQRPKKVWSTRDESADQRGHGAQVGLVDAGG